MPDLRRAYRKVSILALVSTLAAVSACHDRYFISGTVSGLPDGTQVVLEDNGGGSLRVSWNGTFTFFTQVPQNGSYLVTVATQPTGATCTVSNGRGAGVTANVDNVSVACSTDTYTISGSLSGLAGGAQVVLEDNGADPLTVSANGSFRFATPAAFDGSYLVTVATQPAGATCTVSNGSGAGVTADIESVSVVCASNTFTIGGTVSGLANGAQVTLDDNGASPLTLRANGVFTFATPVVEQGSYNVTLGTQPVGQTCTVSNGSGTHVNINVANVAVTCSADAYTIGGTVSGLAGSTQVTLDNNGSDALTLTANGAFTFPTPIAYGGAYAVTIDTQPIGQFCAVTNDTGSDVAMNISTVGVSCAANLVTFAVPGTYTWTVPAGVSAVQIVATGGGGGGGGTWGSHAGQTGGGGAVVTSTLSVTAGQVLTLVVGGGGGAGAIGPGSGNGYTCGAGGGGGGSSTVDAGGASQIIAGGGGGGGSCNSATAGGSGGGSEGAGGNGGAIQYEATGGSGGVGGVGGAGGVAEEDGSGFAGSNGSGGAGGVGGNNGGQYPGGAGGSGTGAGTGGIDSQNNLAGGGGGGYGGGGTGTRPGTGGGAGGSTGPAGTTYAPASNGGGSAANGGDGSIVITIGPVG